MGVMRRCSAAVSLGLQVGHAYLRTNRMTHPKKTGMTEQRGRSSRANGSKWPCRMTRTIRFATYANSVCTSAVAADYFSVV